MHWMFLPLRRYARFHGRATRREFWLFHLFFYGLLIGWAIGLPLVSTWFVDPDSEESLVVVGLAGIGFMIVIVAMFIPSLTVSIRRIHDHDKPGWFFLFSFVPLVGWLFWLMLMLTPGTQGGNSYGDDPREAPLDRIAGVFS